MLFLISLLLCWGAFGFVLELFRIPANGQQTTGSFVKREGGWDYFMFKVKDFEFLAKTKMSLGNRPGTLRTIFYDRIDPRNSVVRPDWRVYAAYFFVGMLIFLLGIKIVLMKGF